MPRTLYTEVLKAILTISGRGVKNFQASAARPRKAFARKGITAEPDQYPPESSMPRVIRN